MYTRLLVRALTAAAAVMLVAAGGTASAAENTETGAGKGFVTRQGADLKLDGKTFRFAGSNNYYLHYQSRKMVDDVLGDAAAAGFDVLRTWGFMESGQNGVSLLSFDGTKPVANDGPDGLGRLDYVLKAAHDKGLRLVIPLTNNWSDFGGMDQYVKWRGGSNHDDFYTDPVIRGWYKDWIAHVLNRTNALTGVQYKNDPTVLAWELANEPRCGGSGQLPRSANCTDRTLVNWADDVTRFMHGVDRNHLVGVGDEGFLCTDRTSSDWTINCADGVDSAALAALPGVDLASFHLYPDGWGKDAAWGTQWIRTHAQIADRVHKPVMLGEFGIKDKSTRNLTYKAWTDEAVRDNLDGFLYWILSGVQDDGTNYPDYDGFTVYCPSPVCTTIANAGDELRHGQRSRPPVADDDTAQTLRDEAVTLQPAANDIAYRTRVKPSTIHLDAASTSGGTFALNPATGAVTFTPAAGFQGKASTTYTIRDEAGRVSNPARIEVTVRPRPGDALLIAGFEDGTDGFAPGNWQANAGTVAPTSDFHTQGASGLRVTAADGGWFGIAPLPAPLDLSAKGTLKYDLRTAAAGTSTSIAVQTGDAWTWCQSTFGWIDAGTSATVSIDLTTAMSCDATALADVRVIYVWISGGGSFDIDNIRAE
ncbi:cellulase family glycosylhydrolase [Dactylosporangium matsuzakiense]|uniref:mannan endo-1,4-beta-mannosidase n=1 Tax=Dactylosporangium matsuzakiense TaxID=53360 RepID=A0A9W6KR57_9ACTN|nr:cellulase family glycosylhydrolase [Dactylosporangium matsuzakiense]UWZ41970.1 cellulase family glycosylhydrolase [Dactylosporangium matsuzakiense]GLL04956.1 hypothetical protein GCM10017581_067030 [Dactylosporangium matsuzakiense]